MLAQFDKGLGCALARQPVSANIHRAFWFSRKTARRLYYATLSRACARAIHLSAPGPDFITHTPARQRAGGSGHGVRAKHRERARALRGSETPKSV